MADKEWFTEFHLDEENEMVWATVKHDGETRAYKLGPEQEVSLAALEAFSGHDHQPLGIIRDGMSGPHEREHWVRILRYSAKLLDDGKHVATVNDLTKAADELEARAGNVIEDRWLQKYFEFDGHWLGDDSPTASVERLN